MLNAVTQYSHCRHFAPMASCVFARVVPGVVVSVFGAFARFASHAVIAGGNNVQTIGSQSMDYVCKTLVAKIRNM